MILTWLNDLARVRFNKQLPVIQMCQHKLEATESLGKRKGMLVKDIITLSLELGMILLLEDENNVTCNCIRLQAQTLVSNPKDKQAYN